MYFIIPLFLIFLNCFRIDVSATHFPRRIRANANQIYGWIEVISSSIKLVFLLIVICFMVTINVGGRVFTVADVRRDADEIIAGTANEATGTTCEFFYYRKCTVLTFTDWDRPVEYDSDAAGTWFNSLA